MGDPCSLVGEAGTPANPGQVRAFLVHDSPKIAVVPNFLSPEECRALIAAVKREPIEDTKIYHRVEQRCANLAGLPLLHMEPIKVSYADNTSVPDGVLFSPEKDGSYCKRFGCTTICLFLNDVLEGGELRFP